MLDTLHLHLWTYMLQCCNFAVACSFGCGQQLVSASTAGMTTWAVLSNGSIVFASLDGVGSLLFIWGTCLVSQILLQVQQMSSLPQSQQYKGIWDALRRIPLREGGVKVMQRSKPMSCCTKDCDQYLNTSCMQLACNSGYLWLSQHAAIGCMISLLMRITGFTTLCYTFPTQTLLLSPYSGSVPRQRSQCSASRS